MKESGEILIIEEDQALRSLLLKILTETCNLSVHMVENGHDALEWLKSNKPRLIIFDYNIHSSASINFLKIKSEDPEICCIPTIVTTTASLKSVEHLKEQSEVLSKPFELETLLDYIQKHI